MSRALRTGLPLVVAAVPLAVGHVGWWLAWETGRSEAARNAAVVDVDRTTVVQAEVSQALTAVLTYDHTDPAPTEQAADTLLAGDARREYDTLFASLQERAPDQELVLTAQVQAVAVKSLSDGEAELLVFLDQSSQRVDDDEASISAAQLAVTAEQREGAWVVTSLRPL